MPKTKSKPTQPKTQKNTTKQQPATQPVVPAEPRRLQAPKRVWHKPFTWRHHALAPVYKPLSKARILFWNVLKQLRANWKLFGGIILIYGILDILLVRGVSGSSDLTNLKGALDSVLQGFGGKIVSSLTAFSALLASSGSGNTANSGVYQSILFILSSLAFIWALRQTIAKQHIRVRDSFYSGMYPLVPFLLMFLLLGVQLLPLIIGSGLYSAVTGYGIAVHLWEKIGWILFCLALALWSLRMITASIFALYIVTLPGMTPLRAYRSARDLVHGRRLLVWRKLIFLPVILLLLAILIELPLILFVTPLAVWMFFALSMTALPVVHGYLYNLYREML